jgi:23S rRNA (cytosine1962-C5)-methyltransferase
LKGARLTLKAGREKSLLRQHPWVFSGAVERVEGAPGIGATVSLHAHDGSFVAWGAYSPQSNIRARVWSFEASETIDAAFIAQRLRRAIALRARLSIASNGQRLVHGESDGLPGIVVDRYGDVLVMQLGSAGAEAWRDTLVAELLSQCAPRAIVERSDLDVRALEGLAPRVGVMHGSLEHGAFAIAEHGLKLGVDVLGGHKTGFYLDQRDNRKVVTDTVAAMVANGQAPNVLNCFCYTGGFSVAALQAGAAHVMSVDSSGPALALAAENLTRNGLDTSRATWVEAEVGKALRDLRNRNQSFDLIVLDPPKYAPTPAAVERASRAYKDINLLGLKLLKPGGQLFTFSCSGGVSAELFQKIVAGAAADAKVQVRIVRRLEGAADHPAMLHFPEGEYLKGLQLERL